MKNYCKKISFIISGLLLICCSLANAGTLQQAVAQTIQTNPEVLVKLKGWLAAQKGIRVAQGGYLPSLDLTGEGGIENINSPIEDKDNLKPIGAGLTLQQMIFDGFATPSEVQRNEKLALAEQYTVQGTSNDIALLTTKAYLDVMRTRQIVKLAQQNYRTHQRIYSMIKRRSESGLSRKADRSQAFGRLSRAKANLLGAQNNYRNAIATYYKIVGTNPYKLQTPKSPKPSYLPLNKKLAIQEALDNHPTLKAAKADIEEAQAQHRAAKAPYYPRLDAILDGSTGSDLEGYDGHYHDYRAMLRLKYNLFNGGSDKARVEQTALLVEQAEQIQNNTYNQVVENMKLAWNDLQTSQQQLGYLKKHRNAATSTVKAYYKQFTLGKRTLLDVLNTEDELFTAKVAYIDGQSNLLLSKYRVLNANGKILAYLHVPDPTVEKPPAAAAPMKTQQQPKAKTAKKPVPVKTAKPGVVTKGPAAPPKTGYKVASKHIAPKIKTGYTLQLYNSYNKNEAINFIVKNKMHNKAAFYKTKFLNRDKYIVIYGAYKTPAQALGVIESLPKSIQKWNPTVKPISKVQQEMRI
jgi:adhesin transport system outer membrane protein